MLLALTEIAQELQISITVAHLNHGIRGRAADADEKWVRALAERLGLPCIARKVSLRNSKLRGRGESLEMAARRVRYDFLARAARQVRASCIVTAHTADDQAETVLMMLARGCGAAGLAGIPAESSVNGARILRPLLDVSRAEVVQYLKLRGAQWREDSTNRDTKLARNRVRHCVLPFLAANLNPNIAEALRRVAAVARENEEWMDSIASRMLKSRLESDGALNVSGFSRLHPAAKKRVLRLWLRHHGLLSEKTGFNLMERLDRFASSERGSATVKLPDGAALERRYQSIRVAGPGENSAQSASPQPTPLKIAGLTRLEKLGLMVTARIQPGIVKDRKIRPGMYPARASLNIRAAGLPIVVRTWRRGDRMTPLGFRGSRKLQDIFVDAKVPAPERLNIPVFECLGEIVWIPGYSIAAGWEVTDPSSNALQLEVARTAGPSSCAAQECC